MRWWHGLSLRFLVSFNPAGPKGLRDILFACIMRFKSTTLFPITFCKMYHKVDFFISNKQYVTYAKDASIEH